MPTIKVMAGKYWATLNIEPATERRYKLTFSYNPHLIEEVKAMEGARWNPGEKAWYISASKRNQFTLDYLMGKNPYSSYLTNIEEYSPKRAKLMHHQKDILNFELTRRRCIIAAEPGCGKTLAAIEAMELSGHTDWLWVGPNSALEAVKREFLIWQSYVYPPTCTYDSLKKLVNNWPKGKPIYKGIVFDESQKLKNPNTQRFKSAQYIVEAMLEEWEDPYIILLTGTPAPNSPVDWYSQVELICPGYLREGNIEKFKRRMGLIVIKDSLVGGKFPELVTWWDDENKCKTCGKYENDVAHDIEQCGIFGYDFHPYVKSINEVEKLYKRLKGLVHVTFKKDVLDLPDKIFRIIELTPSADILRAAKLIVKTSKNAAHAAIRLRELSDGFQYQEQESGTKICTLCHGRKIIEHYTVGTFDYCPDCGESDFQDGKCIACGRDIINNDDNSSTIDCPHCGGTGEELTFTRIAKQIDTPKEQALIDYLEEYEDVGRVVIYAGFEGSVNRCINIVQKQGWDYIRVDGRGWVSSFNKAPSAMLNEFQDKKRKLPKIAFIAQPDAGGLGLTLTESPVEIFYSNSVIPGSRQQAIDRIHRPGMDHNRGATIIDLCHLPSDKLVLEKLNAKQKVQSMSLGEFSRVLGEEE